MAVSKHARSGSFLDAGGSVIDPMTAPHFTTARRARTAGGVAIRDDRIRKQLSTAFEQAQAAISKATGEAE